MEVERELVESCLQLFEEILDDCDPDCDCIIHALDAALAAPQRDHVAVLKTALERGYTPEQIKQYIEGVVAFNET